MEKSTKTWVNICAAVAGLLAVIGWVVAIYASGRTPEIKELVVKAPNGGQSTQSKAMFLFAPVIFQTFIFVMFLNTLIRWKRTVQRAAERAAPKDLWAVPTVGQYRFSTVVRFVTAGLCAGSGMSLYWIIERAEELLSKSLLP